MVQLVDASRFQLAPDLAGGLAGGIQAGQQIRGAFTQQAETESEIARQNQFRQLSGIANDPSRTPQERLQAQQQLSAVDPERKQRAVQQQIATMSARDQQLFQSVVQGAAQINAIPTPEGRLQAAKNRKQQLLRDGITNTTETDMLISALEQGDEAGAQALLDKGIEAGQLAGILEGGIGAGRGAGIKSFAPITIVNPTTKEKRLVAPTVDPISGQAILEPFSLPEGFEVSKETAEEKRAADVVAIGEKEAKKLSAQLKLKPQIEKAVVEAKAIAANRGEAFTELSQAKAALPGLTTAVDNLKELALVATSTFGGRVFDTAVRESGFGATKGATARAKFIAIVNNQVLPLLKPTFGAAFTVQEGEALKATMGDPDASPQEKMAQLDAFIAQKMRDIETKEALLQQPQPGQAAPQQPAPPPAAAPKFLGFE